MSVQAPLKPVRCRVTTSPFDRKGGGEGEVYQITPREQASEAQQCFPTDSAGMPNAAALWPVERAA